MLKNIFYTIILSTFLYAGNIDLSFKMLFLNASFLVKLVIVLLVILSIVSWGIFITKISQTIINIKTINEEIKILKNEKNLQNNYNGYSKMIFDEISDEISVSIYKNNDLKNRIKLRLEMFLLKFSSKQKSGVSLLASIGALSPFIGLFGTVWGIMNSFIGIANSSNVSLNVVAPGIAEALFATAIGLGVAIPAVFFYNQLTKICAKFTESLDELVTLIYIICDRNTNAY